MCPSPLGDRGADTLTWEGPSLPGAVDLSEQNEGGVLAGVKMARPATLEPSV